MGEIERPRWYCLEFRENPYKHVTVRALSAMDEAPFFGAVKTTVDDSSKKAAFVFIHGYNVSFKDALLRTGQIAYDLRFDGAAICYSWPSDAGLAGYTRDEADVEWTEPHLGAFLQNLLARSGARSIHLVAHSMGSRALTRAFKALVQTLADHDRHRVRNIILAAPDIDADVFAEQIAPALAARSRVTLYASKRDWALRTSRLVHGATRLGDVSQGLVRLDTIDTIDASNVDSSLLGHSPFATERAVLDDMFYIITRSLPPDQRAGLERVPEEGFWQFRR